MVNIHGLSRLIGYTKLKIVFCHDYIYHVSHTSTVTFILNLSVLKQVISVTDICEDSNYLFVSLWPCSSNIQLPFITSNQSNSNYYIKKYKQNQLRHVYS